MDHRHVGRMTVLACAGLVSIGCYDRGVLPDPSAPVPAEELKAPTKDDMAAGMMGGGGRGLGGGGGTGAGGHRMEPDAALYQEAMKRLTSGEKPSADGTPAAGSARHGSGTGGGTGSGSGKGDGSGAGGGGGAGSQKNRKPAVPAKDPAAAGAGSKDSGASTPAGTNKSTNAPKNPAPPADPSSGK